MSAVLHKQFFLFYEGQDDKAFLERVVQPLLLRRYRRVRLLRVSESDKFNILKQLADIKKADDDYLFLTDIDSLNMCISQRKAEKQRIYPALDLHRTLIVKLKIEGWYLAGASDSAAARLNFAVPDNTESIGKKKFGELIGVSSSKSLIASRQELLKDFDIEKARTRNASFNYFFTKLHL